LGGGFTAKAGGGALPSECRGGRFTGSAAPSAAAAAWWAPAPSGGGAFTGRAGLPLAESAAAAGGVRLPFAQGSSWRNGSCGDTAADGDGEAEAWLGTARAGDGGGVDSADGFGGGAAAAAALIARSWLGGPFGVAAAAGGVAELPASNNAKRVPCESSSSRCEAMNASAACSLHLSCCISCMRLSTNIAPNCSVVRLPIATVVPWS